MDKEANNPELSSQQIISSERTTYYDAVNKFKATAEGCLIEYLKVNEASNLNELENYIESKFSLLRNPKGKKYVHTPEQLTRSTLIRNRRIFNLDQDQKWSLIVGSLEDFENEQIQLISKYAKKKLEKQKQREEEAEYFVFKTLFKLDEVLKEETKESEDIKKEIDETYANLTHNN